MYKKKKLFMQESFLNVNDLNNFHNKAVLLRYFLKIFFL